MNSTKYANLPDIDTAPDVYETEDIVPLTEKNEPSDDEAPPTRPGNKRNGDMTPGEGLDSSHLMRAEEASKRFRKAEKRQAQTRTEYTFPPSPTSPVDTHGPSSSKPVPISHRLRALQAELASLEEELSDPTNPQLVKERMEENVDPGELIRGLVDVRGRLQKIRKGKEGRERLVKVVLGTGEGHEEGTNAVKAVAPIEPSTQDKHTKSKSEVRSFTDMDKRLGELEKMIGSSSVVIDEAYTMPPPLLSSVTRLNAQLTILTQPRHIDSVSRRLKLLLSDLDRATAPQQHGHRRNPSHPGSTAPSANVQDQMLPLLNRLSPLLPQIPHILTRLRTLSSLHTAAGEFQTTLSSLEDDQKAMRKSLDELEEAIQTVEKNLETNQQVIRGNVAGLEERMDTLTSRLEEFSRDTE